MLFQNYKALPAKFILIFILGLTANIYAECKPAASDVEWLSETVRTWNNVRKDILHLPTEKLPWLILFDETCVFNVEPETEFFDSRSSVSFNLFLDGKKATIYSSKHNGKVKLPEGELPPQLISFAATYNGGKSSFFTASLPAMWEKAEHLQKEKHVLLLARSVYIHELTHTQHKNYFKRLDEIEMSLPDVKDLDDDIIQNTFSKNEKFREAYLAEIEFAKAVLREPDRKKRRTAAKELLGMIRNRKNLYFNGKDQIYSEIEDIFLSMEGIANWAAYKAAMMNGMDDDTASRLIRRSGKYWSQEQGFLLTAVLASVSDDWQLSAFGTSKPSVLTLLAAAVDK